MSNNGNHIKTTKETHKKEPGKIKKNRSGDHFIAENAAPPDAQASGVYPALRLARAYVPWQKYGPLFSPSEGLEKGTIFPELYSHYPY